MSWDIIVVHGGASFSNPVHVDEGGRNTLFSIGTASQSSELGRNSRRFSHFTSAKQMAVF
jgi:hypothetical protein